MADRYADGTHLWWQLRVPRVSRQADQEGRKAASLAEISARNMGCRSIDGEYLPAGTSRPRPGRSAALERIVCDQSGHPVELARHLYRALPRTPAALS